jgi:hypothetical protein
MSDWKSDLDDFIRNKERQEKVDEDKLKEMNSKVKEFYSTIVTPAFEELKKELEKHQREVQMSAEHNLASIIVKYEGELELDYSIKVSTKGTHPSQQTHFRDKSGRTHRAEGYLRSGNQDYTIYDITKDDIIKNFISEYKTITKKE